MSEYRRKRVPSFDENPRASSGGSRFFAVAVAIAMAIGFFSYRSIANYGDTVLPKTNFSIMKGDSVNSVPKKLKLDDWRVKWYVKYFAPSVESLQVGTYVVPEGTKLSDVFAEVLRKPDTKDLTVTFLPGWTVFDIDAYLSDMGIVKPGEVSKPSSETLEKLSTKYPFLKGRSNLEGFLYPDTYRIRPDADVVSVLSKAISNFDTKIRSKNADLSDEKFYSTLILASIVEKEERSVANKPKVAGVLQRRLDGECSDTGKIIGADATVCYAYGITSKECTPSFIGEHVYESTEYNTRKMVGLPPTPIANPAVGSFSAAREPESTKACYYLHDSDGLIHFANDAAGHVRNKSRYIK